MCRAGNKTPARPRFMPARSSDTPKIIQFNQLFKGLMPDERQPHSGRPFPRQKLCTIVLTICTYVVEPRHDIGAAWNNHPEPLPKTPTEKELYHVKL